jgi:hypothetical protein
MVLKYYMDILDLLEELNSLKVEARKIEEEIRILNTDLLVIFFEIYAFIFDLIS